MLPGTNKERKNEHAEKKDRVQEEEKQQETKEITVVRTLEPKTGKGKILLAGIPTGRIFRKNRSP